MTKQEKEKVLKHFYDIRVHATPVDPRKGQEDMLVGEVTAKSERELDEKEQRRLQQELMTMAKANLISFKNIKIAVIHRKSKDNSTLKS